MTATAAAQLPPPPVPPENPITEPKRVLGKTLFWDEQLSSDNTIACGTCHVPRFASSDPRPAVHPGADLLFGTLDDSFGSRGVARINEFGVPINDPIFGFQEQVTSRVAPSIFSALWAPSLFWIGDAESTFVDPQTGLVSIPAGGALESQAVRPILSDVEMARENRTWDDVVNKLNGVIPLTLATYLPPDVEAALADNPSYPALFDAAFGDAAITAERIAFAIATYERTLVPNQSRFDLGTLRPQEFQGFVVFRSGGARCFFCHPEPIFTDNQFRNDGVRPLAEDLGRQLFTRVPADAGKFKVPGLRNVGLKPTFMHNGQRSTLEEVIDFYRRVNGQVQFLQNLDPLIVRARLNLDERLALIEFLRHGLTDPRVAAETFPFDRPLLRSEQGDADQDDDVDEDDRTVLEACFAVGPDDPLPAECKRVDMDGDGVMTCTDRRRFSDAWTDPGTRPQFAQCPDETIPTVSEWGMTVMALLLLTGGSLTILNRTRQDVRVRVGRPFSLRGLPTLRP